MGGEAVDRIEGIAAVAAVECGNWFPLWTRGFNPSLDGRKEDETEKDDMGF